MKKYLLASAAIAAAFTAVPANAANIIVNGDFESGDLSPWFQDRVVSGGVDWAVDGSFARTGSFGAGNIGNREVRQDFAGVAAADITSASFWLRHNNLSGTAAFVTFFYADNSNDGFLVNTTTTDFELFDVTGNLDVSKMLVGFSIFGNSTGGNTETALDDVAFLTAGAVPEPATWAFMIFGFGAIGGALRRNRKANVKVSYA